MKKRILWCVSVVVGLVVLAPLAGSASASELKPSKQAFSQRLPEATKAITAASPASSSASVSRRRVRKMATYTARNNALEVAGYVFQDPEIAWTDYGVRSCRRISIPRVDCYSYVAEEVYDDYGAYLDTILCDWFTASAWLRSGRMKVWAYAQECVLLSEV